MNRLALYVHHDPKGEVKDYIFYCLKGLQEIVSEILFIVNGSITSESRRKLEKLGVKILVRENEGFDWWAWKAGIEYYGYDKIAKFDELLLTNNTYYGPIYPFSEMWQKMDQSDCDFWGINKYPEMDVNFIPNNPETKMLEHIQSYWIVFRHAVLISGDFKNYWQQLRPHHNFEEMVGYGETKLTRYFEDHGFKSDCYMDYEKYTNLLLGNPCFLTELQIIEDRCPIAKRKFFNSWREHIINFKSDIGAERVLEYLKTTQLYDTGLIWSDLLTYCPMSTLADKCSLNYVLSTSSSDLRKQVLKNKKIALIIHLYPEDLITYCYEYAQRIPEYIDIYIVCSHEKVVQKCKTLFSSLPNKVEYRQQQNRGRDNTALLITCRDIAQTYDYTCFVHAKHSPYGHNKISGEEFREHCFRSLLHNHFYIENIISLFIKNPQIGLLIPPLPLSKDKENLIYSPWTNNYTEAKRFLFENKIGVNMDEYTMAPFGGMYWFKKEALFTLLAKDWKFEDFPPEPLAQPDGLLTHIIERITPLLAQHDGYATAWVSPDFYASFYLNHLYEKIRKEIKSRVEYYNPVEYYTNKILRHLLFGKERKRCKQKYNIQKKLRKQYKGHL